MRKVLILGAAGRDFHDFNVYWRTRPDVRVVGFTAAQIPNIQGRVYPPELAGPDYPEGIPIYSEEELADLVRRLEVDICTLAYSDLSYRAVMNKAAIAQAAGADFVLLSPMRAALPSRKPVVAVCAVRTGCGKSQTTRALAGGLRDRGYRVAVVRHPMPYGGDLREQVCQRFAELEDLDRHRCTIEEREEYEPHLVAGHLVFAGVDYRRILEAAEEEADVILWDGGNNDYPFFAPDLLVTVVDPLRAGHELSYYPGEINLLLAQVVLVNKADAATPEQIEALRDNVRAVNPHADIRIADSVLSVEDPAAIEGKRVLCIEDGPTTTHGEMNFGAAVLATRRWGAAEIVDPRPYAKGSLVETFRTYRHLAGVLPAMGYGAEQIRDLEETVRAVPCDAVLIGTPIDLRRLITIDKPAIRVRYDLAEREPGTLLEAAIRAIETAYKAGKEPVGRA